MTGANWLRLIGLSVPWGCSFLFLKLLAGELPPMTVALARLLVAAAALSLILAARGVPVLCWTIRSPADEAEARRLARNITFEGYLP